MKFSKEKSILHHIMNMMMMMMMIYTTCFFRGVVFQIPKFHVFERFLEFLANRSICNRNMAPARISNGQNKNSMKK